METVKSFSEKAYELLNSEKLKSVIHKDRDHEIFYNLCAIQQLGNGGEDPFIAQDIIAKKYGIKLIDLIIIIVTGCRDMLELDWKLPEPILLDNPFRFKHTGWLREND